MNPVPMLGPEHQKPSVALTWLMAAWLCLTALAYEQHLYAMGWYNAINLIAVLLWLAMSRFVVWRLNHMGPVLWLFGAHFIFFLLPNVTLMDPSYGVRSVVYVGLFVLLAGMGTQLLQPLVNGLIGIGLLVAAGSLVVSLFDGWLWSSIYFRNASFMFDPNYAGAVLGLSALAAFMYSSRRLVFYVILLAMLATMSRGAALGFVVAFLAYLALGRLDKPTVIKSLAILTLLVAIAMVINFDVFLMRLKNDVSSGRLDMWASAIGHAVSHPFSALGYSGMTEFLKDNGFLNISTHSSVVDMMLINGFFVMLTYLIILIFSLFKSCKKNIKVFTLIFYLFITSNFVNFTMGGLSLLSVVMFYLVLISLTTDSSAKLERA